jgi:predicted CoA-binding protein
VSHFVNPEPNAIRALLRRVQSIAVLGLSPKPDRPSYHVAAAMQSYGYRIIPIRPAVDEILGERVYPDLQHVDQPIDLVDVFRAPDHVPKIVETCIALKLPALWLQEGVINETAALRAQQAGIFVVMDRCVYKDYFAFGLAKPG